jgi:CRISPR/Cas system-associated exonuclease Cas4 (RecB family)
MEKDKILNIVRNVEFWEVKNSGHDSKRNYFGLSNIFECPLSVWFKLHNKELKISRRQALSVREAYMQELDVITCFISAGFQIDYNNTEVKTKDEHLKGHFDFRLPVSNNSDDWIPVDIKAPDIRNWYRIVDEKFIPKKHFAQMTMICHFANKPRGLILYKNIESGVLWPYTLEYRKEKAEQYLAETILPTLQAAKSALKPIRRNLNPKECRFCNFRYLCDNNRKDKR